MKFKQQLALKPGRYYLNGQFRELTPEKIKNFVDNTKRLLSAGNGVTVQLEHPDADSPERLPRDKRAQKLKNQVGWLDDISIGKDGEMLYSFSVNDAEIAKKIEEKTIKATSPHLATKPWDDGKGNVYEEFVAHVALTARPRNTDQTAPEPAEVGGMSFSLEDYVDGINEFGDFGSDEGKDDDDSDSIPESKESSEPSGSSEENAESKPNPDLPAEESDSEMVQRQQWEAIRSYLDKIGIALPADTTTENFMPRLLAALMTFDKASQKKEEEAAAESKENEQVVEENPPLQFSLADVDAGRVENKPLARWIKSQMEAADARLKSLVTAQRISPAMREKLMSITGDMQFSVDGDAMPSMTLPQVVTLLEDTATVEQWKHDVAEFHEESHPEGDVFFALPEGVSRPAEDVNKYLDTLQARHPALFASAVR